MQLFEDRPVKAFSCGVINPTAELILSSIALGYVLTSKHDSETRPANPRKSPKDGQVELLLLWPLIRLAQEIRPVPHKSSHNKQSSHTLRPSLL